MPKFLNNIDLNSNELLNPVIHTSSQSEPTYGPAGNTNGTEGQIFYNSDAKALFFRDDTAWRPIGDISGVSAGAGLSGGGTGGAVALAIDISEFSSVTPTATDSFLTLDSDGSTEQLTTISALATLLAGTGLTASSGVLSVGNAATVTTNANLSGHVTSVGNTASLGSFTLAQLNTAISDGTVGTQTLPTDFVSAANGGTFSGAVVVENHITLGTPAGASQSGYALKLKKTNSSSTVQVGAEIIASAYPTNSNGGNLIFKTANTSAVATTALTIDGAQNATFAGSVTAGGVTLTGTQTNVSGTAATVTGAAQTAITSVGTLTALTVSGNIAANGNISGDNATNIGAINRVTTKEITINTDSSNAVLKIVDTASQSITLGKTQTGSSATDGTDVSVENNLTVKGKLTVQGDVVTESTSNTVIKDNIIQLNDGGSSANTSDIGIVMTRGTSGSVALQWDESDNVFALIATGSDADSASLTMTPGTNNENVAGTANPAGYQTLYAGIIRTVGSVGTAGFYGDGANITGITAANISAGTLAAARGGTGINNFANSTHKNSNTTKSDVGLTNVEDTALSTYTGSGGALDNQYITNGAGYITSFTNTMGTGFTVAATTTGTGTTITQGDSLTIAAGTGISTTGTSDGVVTIASTLTTNATHTGDVTGSGALTLAAAQTNVTSLYNAALKVGRGTDNQIDFATDDHIIFTTKDDSELTLSDTHLYPSAVQGLHLGSATNGFRSLNLIANTNDQHGSLIRIEKQRTNATTALQNDDDLARFSFNGNNAAGSSKEYMRWLVEASDVTTGSEAVTYKQLFLTDGTIRTGFKVVGQTDDTLDVSIGYGATGVTTLAGTLTVGSTAVIDNSGDWVGGAIGQSYIDTETIDESRLQVSNAPTNDYVLVADSTATGGLKWASASTTAGNVATATNLAANTTVAVPVGTIELGHASDTTIARSAAGKATIEGQLIGTVKTFTLNDDESTANPVSSNNNGAASTVFTITHAMGASYYYKVEVIKNSGSYDTVFADIARPTNATITVTFASNVALGAYAAMVTRMA